MIESNGVEFIADNSLMARLELAKTGYKLGDSLCHRRKSTGVWLFFILFTLTLTFLLHAWTVLAPTKLGFAPLFGMESCKTITSRKDGYMT